MGKILGEVLGIVIEVIDVAIQQHKSFKEALATGLEEAAAKVRSGEIRVDDAVAQAKKDSAHLKSIREKFAD